MVQHILLYLATCGSIGRRIAHILEEVFLQAKQQGIGVTLGFNDDAAGRKMAKQATEIARQAKNNLSSGLAR